MGLYFLFPACQTFQQIQSEKNTPYELTATTENGNIDLNAFMQIEGVERISPVVNLNAALSLDEYKLDCEIRAVYSSFLSLKFIQGTMCPDSSNMPYLILNKAAAKAFTHEYQTITITPEDTVMMNANGAERKAIICGIFDDGSENPTVYMSYDAAQKEYGTSGQTELVFLLNNIGSAENVVSALQRQNIYSSFNPNLTLAWELLQKQCWQITLLSVGLLTCSLVLIREKWTAQNDEQWSEISMLLISGMTITSVERIYPVRILLTELLCLCTATFVSVAVGSFTMLGIGVCTACMSALFGCIMIRSTHK